MCLHLLCDSAASQRLADRSQIGAIRVFTRIQERVQRESSERLTRTALKTLLHQHCARDTWRRAPYAACLPPPLRTMRSSLVAALSGLRRNQNLRGLRADASRRRQRHRLLNDSLIPTTGLAFKPGAHSC